MIKFWTSSKKKHIWDKKFFFVNILYYNGGVAFGFWTFAKNVKLRRFKKIVRSGKMLYIKYGSKKEGRN